MMFRAVLITALAGFASANSFSIGCMNTLVAIGQNPEVGTCLQPSLLIPILVGLGNGPDSVIGYIDNWLSSMCGSTPCSNNILTQVVTNATRGCQTEFALPQVQQSLAAVEKSYTTLRKVACLKDGSTRCLTGTLRNIEALSGTMSLNETDINEIVKTLNPVPAKVLCTNCMKGSYTILKQSNPGIFSAQNTKYPTDTCGASFADGGIPPGLIDDAYVPSQKSQASSSTSTTSHSSTHTSTSTSNPKPSSTSTTSASRPTSTNTSTHKNSASRSSAALSCISIMAASAFVIVLV